MSLVAVLPCLASNDSYSDERLRITLVSEQQVLGRGNTGNLGFRFEMQPGWHIYWINPGDSGEPPKVQWQAPSGVEINPLQWPVPERINYSSLVDYGYNGSVLLIAPVKVPSTYAGSSLDLSANLKWLVCREVCVPGKATLQKHIAVADKSTTDSVVAGLFAESRSKLPKQAPSTWKVSARSEGEYFVLDVKGANVAKAVYFPAVDSQIDNAAPQTGGTAAKGSTLRLKKSQYLNGTPRKLEGVLKLPSGEAFTITAPFSAAGAAQQGKSGSGDKHGTTSKTSHN